MKKPLIVSVVNQKGGTGKTTTTINLGSALANLGFKILLVDLDPQANLTYSLGVHEPKKTIVDVFEGNSSAEKAIVTQGKIDILPGSNDLVDIEISLINQKNRESFLKKSLSKLMDYDYIFIDSPPSLSLLTLNSLNAADEVLIPLQLEVLTLQGLDQIMNTMSKVKTTFNPNLRIKGIVLVMYDKRRKLSQELLEYMEQNIAERIFNSKIRLNVKIAEAPSFGQSVVDYDPSSSGAEDYINLGREFADFKGKIKRSSK